MKIKRGRGRPKGWVMPDSVKAKISKGKTGWKHTPETRDKIGTGVERYWDEKRPVSNDLLSMYGHDKELRCWIEAHAEAIDKDSVTLTWHRIRRNAEVECIAHEWAESLSVYDIDALKLILIKERILEEGIDD